MNHRINHQENHLNNPIMNSISYIFNALYETTYYHIKIWFHINFQNFYKINTFLIVLIYWHLINK